MKTSFSSSWKSSTQPRKQRKYRYNAPQHIASKMLSCHLSKELREKYSMRSIRVRKGDKVVVMKGTHKKREGKVDNIDVKNQKIFITGIEAIKKDGNKVPYPLKAPNLLIIELNLEDKKRLKPGKEATSAAPGPEAQKPAIKAPEEDKRTENGKESS